MTVRSMMFASFIAVAACGGGTKGGDTTTTSTSTAPTKTLYDRLGGKDAITAVVDDLVINISADTRIASFFTNADIPRLKTMLVDQICEATGGPCKYTGKSMKESHTGMGVKDEHFTALVEDLAKALDKNGVSETDKTELLTALATMKPDIVQP